MYKISINITAKKTELGLTKLIVNPNCFVLFFLGRVFYLQDCNKNPPNPIIWIVMPFVFGFFGGFVIVIRFF